MMLVMYKKCMEERYLFMVSDKPNKMKKKCTEKILVNAFLYKDEGVISETSVK